MDLHLSEVKDIVIESGKSSTTDREWKDIVITLSDDREVTVTCFLVKDEEVKIQIA